MLSDCTCSVCPVESSRSSEPGAEKKHFTDGDGLWCVVVVGGTVYKQALLTPSQERLDREAAARAADAEVEVDDRQARLAELREMRRAGHVLNSAEQQELMDLLLEI